MFKIKFWISSFRVVEHDSYSIKKSLENHFFVIHEKTWISWYSRILTNLKFFYLLIYQLVQYLRSRYHYSYLYWSSFCQKSPRFCQKLRFVEIRLLFVNFRQKLYLTIFDFLIFVFDFLSKLARFLSKIAFCRKSPTFCQFSPKSLFYNFWLFNFCFWLFWYFQSLFQNEDDLRWSCFLIFDLWPFAFWPFVLSLGTFHPN